MNYWLGLWSASSAVWAGGRCGRVVGDERGWVFGKTIFLKKASFHFHLLINIRINSNRVVQSRPTVSGFYL